MSSLLSGILDTTVLISSFLKCFPLLASASRHSQNLSLMMALHGKVGKSIIFGVTIYLDIYGNYFIHLYSFNNYLLSNNKIPGTGYVVESKTDVV